MQPVPSGNIFYQIERWSFRQKRSVHIAHSSPIYGAADFAPFSKKNGTGGQEGQEREDTSS